MAKALVGLQRLLPPLSRTQLIQTGQLQVSGWCISGQAQQNQGRKKSSRKRCSWHQAELGGTSGRAVGSTGKAHGCTGMLGCSKSCPLQPSPGEQDLPSHPTLLSLLLQFPRVYSSANQSTTSPSPLGITHDQLTADCPDLSAQGLNCNVAVAAAPPRVWPGNTLGVTAIALTSPPASHIHTKPGQTFCIHQREGEGKTLTGLNNLSASLTDADIFDTH